MKNLLVLVVAFALIFSACGGSSGDNNNNPGNGGSNKPTASISASSSPITLGQPTTLTWSCANSTSATASGDWSDTKNLTGSEVVTPTTTGTKTYTITCTGSGGSVSASAQVIVNAQPVPPTAAISPTSATVAFGDTLNFTCQTTGVPAPTVTLSTDIGSISSNGVYTPPTSKPPQFLATVTCTATNGSGPPAISSATVSLVPKIISVAPDTIFCAHASCSRSVRLTVSGFFPGATIVSSEPISGQVVSVSENLVDFVWAINKEEFDPGNLFIKASNPAPGGGDSNTVIVSFVGNQNTLGISSDLAFGLDQALGDVRRFKLTNGAPDGIFHVGLGARGIAVDNQTGTIAISFPGFVNVYLAGGEIASSGVSAEGAVMGVAAKNGHACFADSAVGKLSCFPLGILQPVKTSISIGNTPWSLDMGELDGELNAVVFNAEDLVLSWVEVTGMNLRGFLPLSGLTPLSGLVSSGNGGWQVSGFWSGERAGVVALLAQADKKIIFVDSRSRQEISRATIDGVPIRVAANAVSGKLIVVLTDPATGLTRFVSVDPVTGTVSAMSATADFLATGLAVSSDGSKPYVENRDKFRILANE